MRQGRVGAVALAPVGSRSASTCRDESVEGGFIVQGGLGEGREVKGRQREGAPRHVDMGTAVLGRGEGKRPAEGGEDGLQVRGPVPSCRVDRRDKLEAP